MNFLYRRVFSAVNDASLCLMSLFLTLSACSDVVDLGAEASEEQLVIYGRITDGKAGNEVQVALTSPINGEQEAISDAELILLENGAAKAVYREIAPGRYRLDMPADSAREGNSYQLQVMLPNGKTYLSAAATMPGLVAVDHPRFDASTVEVIVNQQGTTREQRLVQLFVDTDILNQEQDFYLKWNVIAAYSFQERARDGNIPPPCYIINDVTGQQTELFNGAEIKVDRIPNVMLASTPVDSRFAFDFYFLVVQSTMDEAAYQYLSLIDQMSNTVGSIFDKPSAPVPGNFRNVENPDEEVLGYFEVVRSDTTWVRLRSDDVPGFIQPPCPFLPDYSREPPECLGCLLIKNSSYHRPYYWF